MKRFKAKKIKKKKRKIFLFIFFFFFSYIFIFNYLSKHRLKIKILQEDTNYVNINLIDYIDNKIDDTFKNPINYLNQNVRVNKSILVTENNVKKKDNKIKKVSESKLEPIIYLYNTHQTEEYFDYSVYDATKMLANNLNSDGFISMFEENSIPVFLQDNSMKYYQSYRASRYYLNKAYENNSSLKYFFDIHRDSISKDKVTLNFNNKNYAKVLFIIGLENKNYSDNLDNALKLSNIINSKVNNLSKGIYKKQGKGVNGVYNEDFSRYVFLIEVGSKYSTKDEVVNTIDVLKESIKEFINTNDQL